MTTDVPAPKCRYCERTTRQPDGWCRQCAGPNGQASPTAALTNFGAQRSFHQEEKPPRKQPRETQTEDANRLLNRLFEEEADRAQMRGAPGSGKTITGQLVIAGMMERLQSSEDRSGRYMVMCPTIELAKQLREDYRRDGIISDHNALSIHDSAPGFERFTGKDLDAEQSRRLREFFKEPDDEPKIVFVVGSPSSSAKVAELQRESGVAMDGAIFDETHNLGGMIGAKTKKGITERPRVFFDDEPGGMEIGKRVFMTATPRTAPLRQPFGDGNSAAQAGDRGAYLRAMEGQGQLHLDQGNEELFGTMVSSRSYAEAISRGYLNPVVTEGRGVRIRNPRKLPVRREGRIDPLTGEYQGEDQRKSKRLRDGFMSVGAYQSACATLESLADDSSGSSNVLSFSDSIQDADEMARADCWEAVSKNLASGLLDGRKVPNAQQARNALKKGGLSANEERAMRLLVLGKNAQMMSVSSASSPQKRRDALRFLDRERPGESVPKEKWINGWNPSPKVLCNVDVLSEGMNMPSIDRVVMNRPSYSGDSDNYQAMGRASRKWNDEHGNPQKGTGRVTIPETYDGDRQLFGKEHASLVRSLSSIYSDDGTEEWRDRNRPAVPLTYTDASGNTTDIARQADQQMSRLRYGLREENAKELMDGWTRFSDRAKKNLTDMGLSAKDRAAIWRDPVQRKQAVQMAISQEIAKGQQGTDARSSKDYLLATVLRANQIGDAEIAGVRRSLNDRYRQHQLGKLEDPESQAYLDRVDRPMSMRSAKRQDQLGDFNRLAADLAKNNLISRDALRPGRTA